MAHMENHERFLTPEDAAKRLAVSPSAIREWIRQGTLRAVRVAGKVLRVPESAIEEILTPALESPDTDRWKEAARKASLTKGPEGHKRAAQKAAETKKAKKEGRLPPDGQV